MKSKKNQDKNERMRKDEWDVERDEWRMRRDEWEDEKR
jgi:hypothetical protein